MKLKITTELCLSSDELTKEQLTNELKQWLFDYMEEWVRRGKEPDIIKIVEVEE